MPKRRCCTGSGELARLKQSRPEVKLGLLGCMAQHNRVAIMEKAAFLDVVAGPDSYRRLPEMLGRAGYNYDASIDVRLDRAETYADITPDYGGGVRAYVTAMRGCDKFCAFCVVPYVRGRERSIPPSDLMREIGELAGRGVKEVVLLGQTVNAYRFGDTGFGALLRMVASIGGIERIRFTSPHPGDVSESLIEAMATEPKVQPHLHLPLQSGSDRILAAMERGYTVADYLALVARVRAAIPGVALSTDIIAGFHGEEESDFEATTAVMRAVGYDSAFMFKYSVREHTRAFAARRFRQRGRKGPPALSPDRAPGRDVDSAQSRDGRPRVSSAGRRTGAPRRRDDGGQDAAVQDRNLCRRHRRGRRASRRGRHRQRARRFRHRPFADVLARVTAMHH